MQILPLLNFRYNSQNQYSSEQSLTINGQPRINSTAMPKLNKLNADTVSFSGQPVSDCLAGYYAQMEPKLRIMANNFLDAVQAIAAKHKSKGISFAREEFEDTAVKGSKTKVSKIIRSKSFEIRDAIRTTLYVKNPYDLSTLFDVIIPEMKARGYSVAKIPVSVKELIEKKGYLPIKEDLLMSNFFSIPNHNSTTHAIYFRELKKQGYDYSKTKKLLENYLKNGQQPKTEEQYLELVNSLTKEADDIDIRLQSSKVELYPIPRTKMHLIGKPHNNYEDIQLRFVRDSEKDSDNPVFHELLIQFGPNYNKNARLEHEYVYEPLRRFKELRCPQGDSLPAAGYDIGPHSEFAIGKYLDEIKTFLRTNISNKLLANGKNLDYYGDQYQIPIELTPQEVSHFQYNMRRVRICINSYYTRLKSDMKNTPLKNKQIAADCRHDLRLFKQINEELEKTIKKFTNYNTQSTTI